MKKFTISEAARFTGATYQALLYAMRSGNLVPDERTAEGRPIFYQRTLENYKRKRA